MMDMDVEEILQSPRSMCNSRYIYKNYPTEYAWITSLPGQTFAEQLYQYIYGVIEHKCPVCGKDTPFRNIKKGYSTYCSTRCSYKDVTRSNKIKLTMLERYGVENASQSAELQEKKKNTMIKNYGGYGFASKIISNKSNNTILDRYGVENISQLESIKQKKIRSTQNHYGVDSVLQIPENRLKAKEAIKEKYKDGFHKMINQKKHKTKQNRTNHKEQ